jgi:ribonuclease P/MRP protein subunit RPP40
LDFQGNAHELSLQSATRDLGVKISDTFTPSAQCAAAAAKARGVLFGLRSAITNKCPEVFLPLYCALVRPHLEYCVQAWCPYFKKDINLLEKVQRLATRMMWGLKDLDYRNRLRALNLFSLERR